MDSRQNNILKIISTIVLALFFWSFGGGLNIAYAIKNGDKLKAITKKKEKKPEEKLHETLVEIEAVLKDKSGQANLIHLKEACFLS